jgi:hypothetical protein
MTFEPRSGLGSAFVIFTTAISLAACVSMAPNDDRQRTEPDKYKATGVNIRFQGSRILITDAAGKPLERHKVSDLFKEPERVHEIETLSIFTTSGSPCFANVCGYGGCVRMPISADGC